MAFEELLNLPWFHYKAVVGFVQLDLLCVFAWGIFLLALKRTNLKWKNTGSRMVRSSTSQSHGCKFPFLEARESFELEFTEFEWICILKMAESKMIEFRQCSLPLFRFVTDHPYFLTIHHVQVFEPPKISFPMESAPAPWNLFKVVKDVAPPKCQRFWRWREGCSFRQHLTHNWNQYKTDTNFGTKSQRGGNWDQCCGGIWQSIKTH